MNFTSKKKMLHGLEAALRHAGAEISAVFKASHEQLAKLDVPHVIVGGIAVGVHGARRGTDDVDWLVTDDAFVKYGPLVTFKPGLPILMGEVGIDYLSVEGPPSVVERMQLALEASRKDLTSIVICDPELLFYMKLDAGRPKDMVAITELLIAGADATGIRKFLEKAAQEKDGNPKALTRFDDCYKRALKSK